MKRTILLITFFLLISNVTLLAASSPIDKGSKILGTTGYVMYQAGDLYEIGGKSQVTVNIAPSLMFFTSKGFYIGPDMMFYNHTIHNSESTVIGIGPRIGFILNPNEADENDKGYSLYYFSLFAQISRLTESVTTYYYDYYYSYNQQYTYEQEITNYTFGFQLGSYSMISSHFGLDYNLRFFADHATLDNSSSNEMGYTVMFGLGLIGFSY